MAQYSKYNIIYRLQKWLDSVPGQTFMNYAYSWGASIVILGALFKLTHMPGANFWLFLGMGTEVLVFFISGFDRPFDKTADGRDLPTHVSLEGNDEEGEEVGEDEGKGATVVAPGGGTIVIGGGQGGYGGVSVEGGVPAGGTIEIGGDGQPAVAALVGGQPATTDVTEATNNYVEQLQKLTEVLEKVSEQSQRLTTDSEEMENLNRTLTGICKVYEMQLKSASSQIGTIDEINAQTRKMAGQIEELNRIYARMIEAMTVNMGVATPGTIQGGANQG
ncbi:MAG: gliding motility protein GldL [Prevotella sp.]|nr:gliding motility protein GldL [Prevotella sp.]